MTTKADVLTRLVDFVGETIPHAIQQHPVASAAGLGLLLGAPSMRQPIQDVESQLLLEQMGGPSSKYGEDLENFFHKKAVLASKVAFSKSADDSSDFREAFIGGAGKGVGGGIASEGLGAIRRLLGFTAQTIKEKFISDPRRQKIFETVVANDPTIATYYDKNSKSLQDAYETMIRFAPTLSTDPNVVLAFLRHASMTGGVLDHATVKGLADSEAAIHRARNEGAWLRGGW